MRTYRGARRDQCRRSSPCSESTACADPPLPLSASSSPPERSSPLPNPQPVRNHPDHLPPRTSRSAARSSKRSLRSRSRGRRCRCAPKAARRSSRARWRRRTGHFGYRVCVLACIHRARPTSVSRRSLARDLVEALQARGDHAEAEAILAVGNRIVEMVR